jgi:hypothetical protein
MAFREENPDAPDIYDTKVRFPAEVKQLTGGELLQIILSPVATNNASFLIKRNYIEITTVAKSSPAALLAMRIMARFDKTPLEDALAELSDLIGATILVDAQVAEKARTPVSAALRNTITLDGAVRLLAAMAGLQATLEDDILFITEKKAKVAAPKTSLEFRKQRIDRALDELAEWANVTIILDPEVEMPGPGPRRQRAVEVASQPPGSPRSASDTMTVTAKLRPNVSPEAAIRILADMVGLGVFVKDNVYYVTTSDRAQSMRMDLFGMGLGGPVGGLPGFPGAPK